MNLAQKQLGLTLTTALLSVLIASCLGLDHSSDAVAPVTPPDALPGEYVLSWSTPDDWGDINVSPSGTPIGVHQMSYPPGTIVTVTATAHTPAYEFGCFIGTNNSVNTAGAPIAQTGTDTVTMKSNKTIKACFPISGQTVCPEFPCN